MSTWRRPWEPPIVSLRRYGFGSVHALVNAIGFHAARGDVVRLYQYDSAPERPVEIVLNGTCYLVLSPLDDVVVGTFDTVERALLAADRHVETDHWLGGVA